MILLFDENLSPELPVRLLDCFPDAIHVRDVGLRSVPDAEVWAHAAEQGYVIVTKDSDFRQRSFLYGYPPKVIWIGLGNCSTLMIETLLRKRSGDVERFLSHAAESFLVLK